MSLEVFLALAGVLLLLCVFANKISSKFGIPSLLIFLAVGMLAGSDGLGIQFYSAKISNYGGSVALAFILFSGGLETQWKSVRPIIARGSLLSTLGVALTALFLFFFVYYIFRLDFSTALLLSVIVSSTDAPAVFNILRSNNLYLNNDRLKSILEFESGSNDPMAVILSMGAITMLATQEISISKMTEVFVMQMGVGLFCGIFFGRVTLYILKKWAFVYQGLYPVFGISVVFLTYSLTQLMQGNGYLALYLCGIILGNASYPYRNPFIQFQDAMAWVMQIGMFLTLGLLVNPRELGEVFWISLGASICLMFFARPMAVFICLAKSEFTRSDKLFVSWAGLKGAVPIILATYPLIANIPDARYLFNLIFFLVIISVLFQGRTLAPFARFLKLSHDEPRASDIQQAGNAPGLPTGQPHGEEEEADDYKTIFQYLAEGVRFISDEWNKYKEEETAAERQLPSFRNFFRYLRRSYRKNVRTLREYCLSDEKDGAPEEQGGDSLPAPEETAAEAAPEPSEKALGDKKDTAGKSAEKSSDAPADEKKDTAGKKDGGTTGAKTETPEQETVSGGKKASAGKKADKQSEAPAEDKKAAVKKKEDKAPAKKGAGNNAARKPSEKSAEEAKEAPSGKKKTVTA